MDHRSNSPWKTSNRGPLFQLLPLWANQNCAQNILFLLFYWIFQNRVPSTHEFLYKKFPPSSTSCRAFICVEKKKTHAESASKGLRVERSCLGRRVRRRRNQFVPEIRAPDFHQPIHQFLQQVCFFLCICTSS